MPESVGNWLGNVVATVDEVLRPRSISQLQEIVGAARDRLLVMGGRMSKTALMAPPGRRALDMSAMNQIVETAAETDAGSVVVGGGITVYDLSRALYAQGRQIPASPSRPIPPSAGRSRRRRRAPIIPSTHRRTASAARC